MQEWRQEGNNRRIDWIGRRTNGKMLHQEQRRITSLQSSPLGFRHTEPARGPSSGSAPSLLGSGGVPFLDNGGVVRPAISPRLFFPPVAPRACACKDTPTTDLPSSPPTRERFGLILLFVEEACPDADPVGALAARSAGRRAP